MQWVDSTHLLLVKRVVMESIIVTMWWLLWRYRSDVPFGGHNSRRNLLINRLIDYSYN